MPQKGAKSAKNGGMIVKSWRIKMGEDALSFAIREGADFYFPTTVSHIKCLGMSAMTSSEITALLDAQIGGQWDRTNLHGVDIRKCLVTPERRMFLTAVEEKTCEAWLVLLEHPAAKNGYAVIYDEDSGNFGLAQFAEGYEPCIFGLYGNFFEALEAM